MALDGLKSQGAIAGEGLGCNEVSSVFSVVVQARLDALLLAGRYTLLYRKGAAEVMPPCLAAGADAVLGAVFNSGILATGAVPEAHFYFVPASANGVAHVTVMAAEARRQKADLPTAEIRFALDHPAMISVLIGSAKASDLLPDAALLRDSPALNRGLFTKLAIH
jgi:D-threo-aldose 1-dehydrogenase